MFLAPDAFYPHITDTRLFEATLNREPAGGGGGIPQTMTGSGTMNLPLFESGKEIGWRDILAIK